MTTRPQASPPSELRPQLDRGARDGVPTWAVAAVLAIAIGIVYSQALNAPFIFDDQATILSNNSIVSLWPFFGTIEHPGPLRPQAPLSTAGRPAVNLSFAINYLVGGTAPIGYHVVNMFIHFGSALLLWSIVKRTLMLPYFAGRFQTSANWLAFAVALIWALHPLQTEAVIYTTQRTELMVAFFYLATLYSSLRYWSDNSPANRFTWLALAVVASLVGMASKEVMVSAPLVVLLFDRAFVSRSLSKALRRSWPLYVGLAATWLLLVVLNLGSPRGDSAGFRGGPPLMSSWLTQCQVLLMYLKLVIWPSPLLIHYQLPYLESFGESWMYVGPVLLLAVATLVLLGKNRPIGFLGAWLIVILAPTMIVPIITEVAAERRMYLPLAALVVLFVVGVYGMTRRVVDASGAASQAAANSRLSVVITVVASLILGIALSLVSAGRVRAYNEPIVLWRDVVQREPGNFVAHGNLGSLLVLDPGRQAEAIEELRQAMSLKPDYYGVLCNLGLALANMGQFPEAIEKLHAAIALQPKLPLAYSDLGMALASDGQLPEAVDAYRAALARDPDYFDSLNNLGVALTEVGRPTEAIEPLQHALRVQPDNADAHNNLGHAFTSAGRLPEAIEELNVARNLTPNNALVLNNLGLALNEARRPREAIDVLEQALKVRPDFALAHTNLAIALFGTGQVPQATEHFRRAVTLNPKDANACVNLAKLLASLGNVDEAIADYQRAIALQPNRADIHNALGDLFRQAGRPQQAIEHYQATVRLQPDFLDAYVNLMPLLAQADKPEQAVAAAEKAIALSRSSRQQPAAEQLEEWLKHYQTELRRAESAASPDLPQSASEPQKPK